MKFKESYEINIKLENLYVCPTQDITQYSYSRQISSMIVLTYLHFGREGCSPCPLWTHLCLLQWQRNDFENCDKTTRKYIQNAVSLLFFFFKSWLVIRSSCKCTLTQNSCMVVIIFLHFGWHVCYDLAN